MGGERFHAVPGEVVAAFVRSELGQEGLADGGGMGGFAASTHSWTTGVRGPSAYWVMDTSPSV
ncbi:hypothetical protein GCM10010425_75850 [Streptomyces spororaveus]|uniref:Uncharacterized protein n=1 Tax=Streptomyces spororaveus TaxID=284039 RepID=A0ABQ3T3K4_9ACTN|nr:hypothetical protein Sspor_05350 [Streptomyces spororaveus]